MNVFIYDRTFEGFLTLVFDSFELKVKPGKIVCKDCYQKDFLSREYYVSVDAKKAERVWTGLSKKISTRSREMLYTTFLSAFDGIEMLLFKYIYLTFTTPYSIERNYKENCVLELKQINRKVLRDALRVVELLRFQKTRDNIYYASVDPDYDVIRIVAKHFKDRFADQKWVIYDTRREYGIYYDLNEVSEIKIENVPISGVTGSLDTTVKHEEQGLFELLWQEYYDAVNIPERKNMKLHLQFLPRRYWKYLPEKRRMVGR